ncbi:hypothetical protein GTA08_BOTSDO03385 [Neofusicoccum parvum]|uniref:Uncharacterized protein n=1 Tax=Neofusicoccum parvum TaxID=310453 RepID=A0ACB5SHV2_9PEZI|nr:hypothetical protein GTA08_BOTSDO03385 [Neofusicoccum parvum]GME49493.1 hypothetical protein GTA08_BOTSDO03385 [Neofusicoccum parvum]
MQTRAASNATIELDNHAGADAQKPDLSARPAFTFFNKDGPGKTLVIMGTKGDYKVIPQVEKKGPREGWDDDIH